MWCRELVAGALLAATLGACAAVDSSVAPRYDTVSRSIAQARNESILLNIVRASHDYPLSFSTVSQVIPQLTNTTTVGLPSFLEGPNPQCINLNGGNVGVAGAARCLTPPGSPARDVIFGNQNNLTNAVAVQTQFNLSTQETKDFYNALLRPVDLYVLDYFIRQGYSRELLFWLFMDSVQVTAGGRTIGFQFNPPYDYGCPEREPRKRCFREWIELATITGLSVDQHTEKGEGGGKGGRSLSRFCFDEILARRGQAAMQQASPGRLEELQAKYVDPGTLNLLSPKCGGPWPKMNPEEAAGDTLKFHVGPLQFALLPRSAYGIYQFLGRILRENSNGLDDARIPDYIRRDELQPELSSVAEDHKLLNVVLNDSSGGCFAETRFIDGYYCVPEQGSANTKRIFGLLAQLLALQTSASDLAITPTVHTVQ
jgi:hypothetical protein